MINKKICLFVAETLLIWNPFAVYIPQTFNWLWLDAICIILRLDYKMEEGHST